MKRFLQGALMLMGILVFGAHGLFVPSAGFLAPTKAEGGEEEIARSGDLALLALAAATIDRLKIAPKHSWYKYLTESPFRLDREQVEVVARSVIFPHVIQQGEYLLSVEFPSGGILCLDAAYYAGKVQGLIWAMDRDTVEEHKLFRTIDDAHELFHSCLNIFLQEANDDSNADDKHELADVREVLSDQIRHIQGELKFARNVKSKADDGGPKQPETVMIPAGEFQIVNIWGHMEKGQKLVRTVHIRKSFAIGRYEVTFEEYDKFASATGRQLPNDMGWGRGRRPVIYVSWEDARAYAAWLSEQTGKLHRLPTEAEWEYAARSGGRGERWAGTSEEMELREYAWYQKNSGMRTHPVGEKKPNGLGLYDMSGNVWEWTSSLHQPYPHHVDDGRENPETKGQRVVRGGSWDDLSWDIRSSLRGWLNPEFRGDLVGFRVVQALD